MCAVFALAVGGAAPAYARGLIVGGTSAQPGSWPSIVALVHAGLSPSAGQLCGGTLVDVQAVLTAGHCVDDGSGGVVSPANLDVYVGITDLANPTNQQPIGVSSINRHPSFNPTTLDNDVAILHLASPAPIGPAAQVMDLAAPTDVTQWEPGDAAQIAGWGLTSPPGPGATAPNALQEADVRLVADSSCVSSQSYGPLVFNPSLMVCAGLFGVGKVDACNGDSGGPLVVAGLNGTNVLVGATSFTDAAYPCGDPNFPAVYSRLSALRSFVYGALGITGVSPPGAPTGVTAQGVPGGVSLSWSAPNVNGGRAVAGYRITTAPTGMAPSTRDVPAGTQSVLIPGFSCDAFATFSVAGANAVGLGPAGSTDLTISRPSNLTPPAVTGLGRAGSPLTATGGSWSAGAPAAFIWQREATPGSGVFTTIAGATSPIHIPTSADVGRRIAVTVTAQNAECASTALSNTVTVRPRFRVLSTRAPKVTLTSAGLAKVALRLRVEPRTRLAIRIVDPAGAIRAPISKSSRIDGAVPRVVTRRLEGRLGTASIHPVTVAFRGRSRGTLRTIRIVIVATSTLGERTETTVRARVRL